MVIQELQSVALFYQIAVTVISESKAVLSGSPPSCVVRKGIAIESGQLSAVCPGCALATVGGRVTDRIVGEAFPVIREQAVAVLFIHVRFTTAFQRVKLFRRGGRQRILISGKNIATVIVGKAGRYRLDTKRKNQTAKGDTVWKNLLIFLRIKNDLAKLFYLLNKIFLENVFY